MKQIFFRFNILSDDSDKQIGHEERYMLINVNHIVSIRPINIMTEENILEGFWIRTTTGKKYRAISIPQELQVLLDHPPSAWESSSSHHASSPQ